MIVQEPLTAHGIKEFIHPHGGASHTASIFLKKVGGNWEYHQFPVDVKMVAKGKTLTAEIECGLGKVLEGREHEVIAGYGFQMEERKRLPTGAQT